MICDLYPGANVDKPMLISKQPREDVFYNKLESGDYLGQIKKDGYFYQLHKTKTGEVYLFSRSLSKVTGFFSEKIENVPHIKEWANRLPNDTVLIGEIYYPGKKSNDVTKIMGALPATAIKRQQESDKYGGLIRFYVHDIIRYAGEDLITDVPFEVRYFNYLEYMLGDAFSPWYNGITGEVLLGNSVDQAVELARVYTTNLADCLNDAFAAGEEGMVFKLRNGLYVPGKRPTYNFKAKTETTFDAIIIDFIAPEKLYTGKEIENWNYWEGELPVTKAYYNGWVAGVVIGALDHNGKVVEIGRISSGMTDYLREDMAAHPANYLSKVVEIQAMSVNSTDLTVRHGRLVRLRPDKEMSDCTVATIF